MKFELDRKQKNWFRLWAIFFDIGAIIFAIQQVPIWWVFVIIASVFWIVPLLAQDKIPYMIVNPVPEEPKEEKPPDNPSDRRSKE